MNKINKLFATLSKEYPPHAIRGFMMAQNDETFNGDIFSYYKISYLVREINVVKGTEKDERPQVENFIIENCQTHAVYKVSRNGTEFIWYNDSN